MLKQTLGWAHDMDEELANIVDVAEPGLERIAVFCVPENERKERLSNAEASVREAMKNVDPEALKQAADEAQAAGASASLVLKVRRQVRCLMAKEALAVAMLGSDVNALEEACSSAESAGALGADVSRARRRVQRLQAAQHLASAMKTVDPDHIERLAAHAEARGVNTTGSARSADVIGLDTGAVAEAKREVFRLRAEQYINRALLRDDPIELERAANEALSAGTFTWAKAGLTSMAQEARNKAGKLRAEAALKDAVAVRKHPKIDMVADEANAAGVHNWDVSDARRQANWLRSMVRFDIKKKPSQSEKAQTIPHARSSWLRARARPTHHTTSALCSMRGHVHGETSTAGLPSGLPPMCPLALRRGHQQ